ncbi:hypothetical protein MIR68_002595 [Amoeboaphelidium protococcarum]|nr:hypothetical protein MIR68_002595 [Amoeboaphelidium protococcarum]
MSKLGDRTISSITSGNQSFTSNEVSPLSAYKSKKLPDFVFQAVFSEFTRHADQKIVMLLNLMGSSNRSDAEITKYLTAGSDPDFDRAIENIGSLSKHRTKGLIDGLMYWRKGKSDPVDSGIVQSVAGLDTSPIKIKEITVALKERKVFAANFVLCRALISILGHIKAQELDGDLGQKLEEMMFQQIRLPDSDANVQLYERYVTIQLFAECLGWLSRLRFVSVKQRIFNELANLNSMKEAKAEQFIKSLKYVRLKMYPQDALEQSVQFVQHIAGLFNASHSSVLKLAYASLITDLLMPLGQVVNAEVNLPTWSQSIDLMYQKGYKMIAKPRYLNVILPLLCALLGVTKKDQFMIKFNVILELCMQKLKDKTSKNLALVCINRLLWVYNYRCTEAISPTHKRIDSILKVLNPGSRKPMFPSEIPADIFVHFTVIIAVRHYDYMVKNWFNTMLMADQPNGILDMVSVEKVLVAFYSICSMLNASSNNSKPDFVFDSMICPSGDLIEPLEADVVKRFDQSILKYLSEKSQVSTKYSDLIKKYSTQLFNLVKQAITHLTSYSAADDRSSTHKSSTLTQGTISALSTISSNTFDTLVSTSTTRDKSGFYEFVLGWLKVQPLVQPAFNDDSTGFIDYVDVLVKLCGHHDQELASTAGQAVIRLMNAQNVFTDNKSKDKDIIVVDRMAKFIRQAKYLPNDQTESLLDLYCSVIEVFISSIVVQDASHDSYVDLFLATEQLGVIHICNFIPAIRSKAVKLLKLSKQLIQQIVSVGIKSQSQNPYQFLSVIEILNQALPAILSIHSDDYKQIPEILYKHKDDEQPYLLTLIASDNSSELQVWDSIFPEVFKLLYSKCPSLLLNVYQDIVDRFLHLFPNVMASSDPSKYQSSTLSSKWSSKTLQPASAEILEQWKMYLVYICVCIQQSDKNWKPSKSKQSVALNCIQELSSYVLQLINSENSAIRQSVVIAFGNLNFLVLKDFLEEIQSYIKSVVDDMRARYLKGSTRRVKRLERLRANITNILFLSCNVITIDQFKNDSKFTAFMLSFIKEVGAFLSDMEVQMEWDHQILRYYFAQLVARYYYKSSSVMDHQQAMPYELRFSLYELFEEWCGYGPKGGVMKESESKMIMSVLEHVKDVRERAALTSAMEEQRKSLEVASAGAIASLCFGTIMPPAESVLKAHLTIPQVFEWIDLTVCHNDEKIAQYGERALKNAISANRNDIQVLELALQSAYDRDGSSYLADIYLKSVVHLHLSEGLSVPLSRLLQLASYNLWSGQSSCRKISLELLQYLAESSIVQLVIDDVRLSILSQSWPSVRHGSSLLTKRLFESFIAESSSLMSELFIQISKLHSVGQEQCLNVIEQWAGLILLSLGGGNDSQNTSTLFVLHNFVHLTAKYGSAFESKLVKIWTKLAMVQDNLLIIIEFLINECLNKRNSSYLLIARKVVGMIARGSMSQQILDYLQKQLYPKNMIPQKRGSLNVHMDNSSSSLYIGSMEQVIGVDSGKPVFSIGNIVLVLVTDLLLMAPGTCMSIFPQAILLSMCYLDGGIAVVKEHASIICQAILKHLALQIQFDKAAFTKVNSLQSDFDKVLKSDKSYQLSTQSKQELTQPVLKMILDGFAVSLHLVRKELLQDIGDLCVKYATQCPVRHIAFRSLQLFQLVNPVFSQKMLADLLARLSNTICDSNQDVQVFAQEILRSLHMVVGQYDGARLLLFPQLFWACLECLNSCVIVEYQLSLDIVYLFLSRLDFSNDLAVTVILSNLGLQSVHDLISKVVQLLMKGLQSSKSYSKSALSLHALCKILPPNFASAQPFGMFNILLCLVFPMLLQCNQGGKPDKDLVQSLQSLSRVCRESSQISAFSRLFDSFINGKLSNADDIVKQFSGIMKDTYMSQYDVNLVQFCLQMLNNKDQKLELMIFKLLKALLINISPASNQLNQLTSESLLPLVQRLVLPSATSNEAQIILDEVIRILLTSSETIRLSNVAKMKSLDVPLILERCVDTDDQWLHRDSDTQKTRSSLSQVISSYIATRVIERTASSDALHQRALQVQQMQQQQTEQQQNTTGVTRGRPSITDIDMEPMDYQAIVDQFEDLGQFFTEDLRAAGYDIDSDDDNGYLDHRDQLYFNKQKQSGAISPSSKHYGYGDQVERDVQDDADEEDPMSDSEAFFPLDDLIDDHLHIQREHGVTEMNGRGVGDKPGMEGVSDQQHTLSGSSSEDDDSDDAFALEDALNQVIGKLPQTQIDEQDSRLITPSRGQPADGQISQNDGSVQRDNDVQDLGSRKSSQLMVLSSPAVVDMETVLPMPLTAVQVVKSNDNDDEGNGAGFEQQMKEEQEGSSSVKRLKSSESMIIQGEDDTLQRPAQL